MAGWKVHIGFGILFAIILIVLNYFGVLSISVGSWHNYVALVPLVVFYSLLTDIDHPSATVTQFILYFGVIINGIFVFLFNVGRSPFEPIMFMAGLLLVTVFATKLPHRGIVHTVTAGLVFSLPLIYFFNWVVALFAFTAYWSHLWADIGRGKPFYPLRLWGAWK